MRLKLSRALACALLAACAATFGPFVVRAYAQGGAEPNAAGVEFVSAAERL